MSEKRQQKSSSLAKLNQMSPAASSQKPNEHTQRIDHQLSDGAPEQTVVPISPASESEAPFKQDGISNSRTSRAELPSQEAPQLPHSGDDVAAGRLPSTLDPTVTLAMGHPLSATAGGGTERRKKRSSSVSLSRKKAKPLKQGRDRGVSLTSTERRALKPPVFVVQSPTLDNKQTLEEGSDPKAPPSCKTLPTLVRSGTTRLTNVPEQPPLPGPSDVQCSDSSQPYSRLGQWTTASKREFQTSPVRRVSQTAPQTAVSPSSTRRLGLESPTVQEPYGPAVSMNRQKLYSQMQPSKDGADNAAVVVASSPQSQPVRRTIGRSEMAPASPKEDAAYGTPLLGPRYITKRQSTASFHSFAPQTPSAHGTQLELSKSNLRAGAAAAMEDPLLKARSGTVKILSPPPSSPKSVAPSLSRPQLTQQGKAGSSSTILNPEGAQTDVRVSVIQEPSLRSGISLGGPVDVSKAGCCISLVLKSMGGGA